VIGHKCHVQATFGACGLLHGGCRLAALTLRRSRLARICKFIGAEFVPGMLHPHQYGSSFDNIGAGRGADRSSLDRWQTSISPFTVCMIDFLHPFAI